MARRTTTRNVRKPKAPVFPEVLDRKSNRHAIPLSRQLLVGLDVKNAKETDPVSVDGFDIEGLAREGVKVIAEPGQELGDNVTAGRVGKTTRQVLSPNVATPGALPSTVHAVSENIPEPVVLPCIQDASNLEQKSRTKLTISPRKSPHFASSGRARNMLQKRKASARPSQALENEEKSQEPLRSSKRKKYDQELSDGNRSVLDSVPEPSNQTSLPNKRESSSSVDRSKISSDSKAAPRAARKDRQTEERAKRAVRGAKSQETPSIPRSSTPMTETERHHQSRKTRSSLYKHRGSPNMVDPGNASGKAQFTSTACQQQIYKKDKGYEDVHLLGSSQQPKKAMKSSVMPGKKQRNKRLKKSSAEQENQLTAFQNPMIQ